LGFSAQCGDKTAFPARQVAREVEPSINTRAGQLLPHTLPLRIAISRGRIQRGLREMTLNDHDYIIERSDAIAAITSAALIFHDASRAVDD